MSADLWAMGCILFQMLVGRPPFQGENEYLTFQQISAYLDGKRNLATDYPPGVPEPAISLVNSLLVKEPGDRLGAASYDDIKCHPFFLEHLDVEWPSLYDTPPPPPPPVEPLPPITRNLRDDFSLIVDAADVTEVEVLGISVTSSLNETIMLSASSPEGSKAGSLWHSFLEPDELIVLCVGLVFSPH